MGVVVIGYLTPRTGAYGLRVDTVRRDDIKRDRETAAALLQFALWTNGM